MAHDLIAITGASGGLGGRVAQRLARQGVAQRLIARDPADVEQHDGADVVQVAGYRDGESMRRAFEGAGTLLLVSAEESDDRSRVHRTAIDAATAAGVERIVYTSFLGAAEDSTFTFARDHFHAEAYIRSAGVDFTFVRDSLYVDFLPLLCGPDGVIRGPAAEGRFAPVARDDVADALAVVLTGDDHAGRTYTLTGPDLLTMSDVAAELSRATRRQIRFEDETIEEAWESRRPSEAPDWEIEGWISTYTAIAAGELELVTEDVERLTGHGPVPVADWLRANPESLRHLQHTS